METLAEPAGPSTFEAKRSRFVGRAARVDSPEAFKVFLADVSAGSERHNYKSVEVDPNDSVSVQDRVEGDWTKICSLASTWMPSRHMRVGRAASR